MENRGAGSRLKLSNSEKTVAEELIKAGYKALAKKFHPDAGGSKEQFQDLGLIKDKLIKAI
jgi:curved DNA-binding protein CbpA